MLGTIITHGAVALICWNLLPQPQWVKRLYDRALARIRG